MKNHTPANSKPAKTRFVAVLIVTPSGIALVREDPVRRDPRHKRDPLWKAPGGHGPAWETPAQTAVREVLKTLLLGQAPSGGFKNRGTLVEGSCADVVVYDLNKLAIKPLEIVNDFPGGEWRRVQRSEGYSAMLVNGEVTFQDGKCSGATPGRLLRSGG